MDRRDFIKLASVTGLSVVSPTLFAGPSIGGSRGPQAFEPYSGKFFIFFHATGGWHPFSMCDVKPAMGETDPDPRTHILATDTIGEIEFPTVWPDQFYNGGGFGITDFFTKHAPRLTVINGIDMMTNGHDDGRRHTWSGRLDNGYPAIGALIAGAYDPSLPMSYLAFGGFSETMGVVGRTRANNLDVLAKVAYPERSNPNDETSTYQPPEVLELIAAAQEQRDVELADKQNLPKIKTSISSLFAARAGSDELRKLQDYLPEDVQGGSLGQVQVALAAYRAGLSVAVEISMGGFDSHSNSDTGQISSLENLLGAVDFAWDEAERQGVTDKVVIGVGSDFGRTLRYNGGMGNDHWPVGSMLFMGAGVPENRVVGATDDEARAYGINEDLTVNTTNTSRKIEPRDIHYSVRKLAGIESTEVASMFPLDGNVEPIDLFA